MKSANVGLVVAIITWLGIMLAASVSEQNMNLLASGAISVYSDQGSSTAINWRGDPQNRFTCLFLESDGSHRCGYNVQLGNDTHGVDLSRYSEIRLAVEYHGKAEQFRISLRNAFVDTNIATDNKYHQVMLPIRKGAYVYNVPLDNLKVADWWLGPRSDSLSAEDREPQRDNVIHVGFDIETPMPIGQHYFKVLQFSVVAPWLSAASAGLWAAATLIYLATVGLLYHFLRLRVQLRERSEEMFGLVRKLQKVDTESAHFKRLSMYDPLTGLLNRRAALELFEDFASRRSVTDTALILMDIDHFKQVNDTFGHEIGDDVLKSVSFAVLEVLREGDAAIRWGGEEILVICPKTSSEGAIRVAEKLRQGIKSLRFDDSSLGVTASFGVANINPDESFDQALRRADEALYHAKGSGRDCVKPADPAN